MRKIINLLKSFLHKIISELESKNINVILEHESSSLNKFTEKYDINLKSILSLISDIENNNESLQNLKLSLINKINTLISQGDKDSAAKYCLQIEEIEQELIKNKKQISDHKQIYDDQIKNRTSEIKRITSKIDEIKRKNEMLNIKKNILSISKRINSVPFSKNQNENDQTLERINAYIEKENQKIKCYETVTQDILDSVVSSSNLKNISEQEKEALKRFLKKNK